MIETIKDIAAVVGCISAIIALCVTVFKPLRKRFVNWIKRKSNTTEIEKKIDNLSNLLKEHIEKDDEKTEALNRLSKSQLCLMRNSITDTYYRYREEKKIPLHIREKLIKEYEDYHENNGNTYMNTIFPEMLEWEVVD